MASEWIRARYDSHKNRIAKQKLREQQQHGAIAACPAMLMRLKAQVLEDMKEYNALFGQRASDQDCVAHGDDLHDGGFSVSVGSSSVRVIRQPDTAIICFEYFGKVATTRGPDCVQSYPNDDGKPGYWYGKDDQFIDERKLSQIILEPILCG